MGRIAETVRSFWLNEKPSRDPALSALFGGGPTVSGAQVNERTALTYSAFWAAVRAIAEPTGSLPLILYRRLNGGGKERMFGRRLYRLLHDEFNPEMTAMVARETMQAHVLTWGNAYAEIERNNNGEAIALWPLTPDRVTPEREDARSTIRYRVRQAKGADVFIPASDMIHVPGLGFDGLRGYSVVAMARESIGLGLATQTFGSAFFGNGAWPGLVAKHPAKLSKEAALRIKQSLKDNHGGADMAHDVIVLEEGMTVEKVGIPPEDAQFLECVAPGTLFTMADGTRRPVESLRVGDPVMAWDGASLTSAKVAAVGRPQQKELVRIRTGRGRELIASTDHPILTLSRMRTPGGRPAPPRDEWRRMGAVQVGQYVRVALGAVEEGIGGLSEDEAYFLGAMVGDGYIRAGECSFTKDDAGVVGRMRTAVESLGGELVERNRAGQSLSWGVRTGGSNGHTSRIRRLLRSSLLEGTHSHDKFVPEIVTRAGRPAWRAFLSGYFDTDGSVRDPAGNDPPAAYWSSTSLGLVRGCQHLLALMGIQSSIYLMSAAGRKVVMGHDSPTRTVHALYVTGVSQLRKLSGALSVSHTLKAPRLAAYRDAEDSRYRSVNFDYDRVAAVEALGPGDTVGVEIEGVHTHVTAGLITHNTRKEQVIEMARWFNLPPHKLRDMGRATWGNVEHEGIDFVTSTLRPWFVRWEQELTRKLISPLERNIQFIEHLIDGLLRGDLESRYRAYATGRNWGWLSADDVLELENRNPLPDGQGQIYLVPSNMAPASRIDEIIDAQVSRVAPPAPADAQGGEGPKDPLEDPEDDGDPDRSTPAPAVVAAAPPREDPVAIAKRIAAHRGVLVELVGRLVRKEANAAQRAAKKGPEAMRTWVGDFYPKHAEILAQALQPAVATHLSAIRSDKDPAQETAATVEAYIEQSRAEIHRLLDAGPADLRDAIELLVSRWEIERPAQLADMIMTEELAHALA